MKNRKQRKLAEATTPSIPNDNTYIKDRSPIIPQRTKLKSNLHIYQRELTEKQKQFLELASNKETKLIFVSGPAGTSKTYLSVLVALTLINAKKVSDLIYIRSAVESSDSKLGFLPGEADEKMAPYIQPLLDKLAEFLPKGDIDLLMKEERVAAVPVGFLRGLNWNAKVIVADECISGNHFIQTSDGKIKLKSLYELFVKNKEIPLIKTYNETNGQFENKKILNVVNKGIKSVISVVLGNRNIVCTPDHKFLTEIGWVEARYLSPFTPVIANNEVKLQTLDVLNDDQLQVFLGSFLGEGNVLKMGENRFRLRVIHGEKQKNYCDWKSNIFHSELEFIKENGYFKKPAFRFTTKCFSMPMDIPIDQKNTCPKWILDKLDARGVAIWYMDDGNINISKNRIRLSTCSFNLDTQRMFVEKFKSFGIECSVDKDEGKDYSYYYLSFNTENSKKLMNLIRPYIHPSMEYKLDETSNEKYIFSNKFLNYRHIIPDKIIDNEQKEVVYDIEVEGNHNFIITSGTRGKTLNSFSGVVVHNCQNMTHKELFTLITRIGEFSKVFIVGDPEQSDINGKSGFIKMIANFDDEESREHGIHVFRFTDDDIVRSGLVQFIIKKVKKVA